MTITTSGINVVNPLNNDICNNLSLSFQNGNSMVGYHYLNNGDSGAYLSAGKNQNLMLYTRDISENYYDDPSYARSLILDTSGNVSIHSLTGRAEIYNDSTTGISYEIALDVYGNTRINGNIYVDGITDVSGSIINENSDIIAHGSIYIFGDQSIGTITNDIGNIINTTQIYNDNSNNLGNLWAMNNSHFYSNVDICGQLNVGTSLPDSLGNTLALTVSGEAIFNDLSAINIEVSNNLIINNSILSNNNLVIDVSDSLSLYNDDFIIITDASATSRQLLFKKSTNIYNTNLNDKLGEIIFNGKRNKDTRVASIICNNGNNNNGTNFNSGEIEMFISDSSGNQLKSFHIDSYNNKVSLGTNAGASNQGLQSVAIGNVAGQYNQGSQSVAIGYQSGNGNQGSNCVGIGFAAGLGGQHNNAISIGPQAGQTSQGTNSIAIGLAAGQNSQGLHSVAIGNTSAQHSTGAYTVSIGNRSGFTGQNSNSVAIGNRAGGKLSRYK